MDYNILYHTTLRSGLCRYLIQKRVFSLCSVCFADRVENI